MIFVITIGVDHDMTAGTELVASRHERRARGGARRTIGVVVGQ